MDAPSVLPSPVQQEIIQSSSIQRALHSLWEGYIFARELDESVWDFSLSLERLLLNGSSENALRWLACRKYIDFMNPELANSSGGSTRRPSEQKFTSHYQFALTDLGAALIQQSRSVPLPRATLHDRQRERPIVARQIPLWDGSAGELWFLGQLIKTFHQPCSNQWAIVDCLHQNGWPDRLDDPLPRREDGGYSNAKQRLHDTVKNLNRGHTVNLLRFHCTEFGRSVAWRSLQQPLITWPLK